MSFIDRVQSYVMVEEYIDDLARFIESQLAELDLVLA